MFIARISRGRTIRQFVGGVILVPSTVSLVWFAIFGGTAIKLQEGGAARRRATTPEGQLFGVLQEFPIATVTSLLVMILVGIFFVSGADAASIVMGTLSQKGTLEPGRVVVIVLGRRDRRRRRDHAARRRRRGDALTGLQNLTILAAAPFTLVMVGMCIALMRDLRRDPVISSARGATRPSNRRHRGPREVRRRLRDPDRPRLGGGPAGRRRPRARRTRARAVRERRRHRQYEQGLPRTASAADTTAPPSRPGLDGALASSGPAGLREPPALPGPEQLLPQQGQVPATRMPQRFTPSCSTEPVASCRSP